MLTLTDPYGAQGIYRRAQLHTHSNASLDGKWSAEALARRYSELGFDFVFITDHDAVTRVPRSLSRSATGQPMVLQGEESTAVHPFWPLGRHMLRLFVARSARRWIRPLKPQELIDDASLQGGLVVLCHPSWHGNLGAGAWPIALLRGLEGFRLMEVCNYHSDQQKDAQLWDTLLAERSEGNPLWAVAVDDAHHAGRAGKAWVEVRVSEVSQEALRSALFHGAFYATTGLALDFGASQDGQGRWHVWVARRSAPGGADSGPTLYAPPDTPLRVRFVRGVGGESTATLDPGADATASLEVSGGERYIRVEVAGAGRSAWSQPIWVSRGE